MSPIYRVVVLALAAAIMAGCAVAQPAAQFKPLSTSVPSNVKIYFEADSTTFPWKEMTATPLPQNLRSSAKAVLERAMSKYSSETLQYNLKRVYIFDKITWQGLSYGGTYDPKSGSVYLLNVGWAPGFIEESFHHEFSSLLLTRYPPKYFTGSWAILSDYSKYAYQAGGVEALRSGKTGTRYDPKSLKLGFLNEYSQSGPEEDFNCISEGMFCGGRQFWENVDGYPAIKEKAKAVMEFYQSIDKRYTEAYLRQLPIPESGSTRWAIGK